MIHRYIDAEIDRVRDCPQAAMLSDKAFERLEESLVRVAGFVAGDALTCLVAEELEDENPIAATFPDLITKDERMRAESEIRRRVDEGTMSLPGALVERLTEQLGFRASAFIEALERLEARRDEISDGLLDGRRFTTIVDVGLSAGDTHNCGRSVTIFHTDAGSFVYKPHDLRVDVQLHEFCERFFQDFVRIPRAVAFAEGFGVSEFVEKRRAEGAEEARRFWYALGGLTAFAKLMGSTDLHYQNILCAGCVPYLIDLETVLYPVAMAASAYSQGSETREGLTRSPIRSLLMPARVDDMELSALMNTDESGIAPVVDGRIVDVRSYTKEYKEGYHDAYVRAVAHGDEIREALRSLDPHTTVRVVLRPTRGYWMMLQKLYLHTSLESKEAREHSLETIGRILRECDMTMEDVVVESEVRQMRRGDVPYFHTTVDGLSLFADGCELVEHKFATSAIDHALDILDSLGEADEAFDLSVIDGALSMYPRLSETVAPREAQAVKGSVGLGPSEVPLGVEEAETEAKRVFDEMCDLGIRTPNGRLVWGYLGQRSNAFVFGDHGLTNGLTGLAVFACACRARWADDESVRERTDLILKEAKEEIRALCADAAHYEGIPGTYVPVGEGSGLGGVLTGIALMRRLVPEDGLDTLAGEVLELLGRTDFAGCSEADRMGGLAGLVSALCRFEEYRGMGDVIARACDRILELKTFAYKDHILWKTMARVPRALSGAGHGMSGIAEALYAAADVCGDDRYVPAADEALDYELEAYARYKTKFGTWADLRDFPPKKYMHGYCAGAPGTGIMAKRMMDAGRGGERARALAERVRRSVRGLPLNPYDHLCCGNAAVAEYHLTMGDREAAGRVLGALYGRRLREGEYRDAHSATSGQVSASLFDGISGIGYEMLRYARPHDVPSIL